MSKTSEDYRARKAQYMRNRRSHAKSVAVVSSIVNAIIADVIKFGQARDKWILITSWS